ncbi:MAG: asparagine synthase-related protein [Armatimonadota bacterium]
MTAGRARFVGRLTGRRLEYFSEPRPFVLTRDSRTIVVFFAGFISNEAELRQKAASRGQAAANSAAEWIAMAEDWWGGDWSRYVLGSFAAAIVDQTAGTACLVVDSLGLGPLFHLHEGGDLLFASRLVDLVTLKRPSGIDATYFRQALKSASFVTDLTPYPGIRRLGFGAALRYGPRHSELVFSWRPTEAPLIRLPGAKDYDQALRAALIDAVDRAAPKNGRVWCEVSGGLDSTSVLAAALNIGRSIEALSFVSGRRMDGGDSDMVSRISREIGARWHFLDIDETPPFSDLPGGLRRGAWQRDHGIPAECAHEVAKDMHGRRCLDGRWWGRDLRLGGFSATPSGRSAGSFGIRPP